MISNYIMIRNNNYRSVNLLSSIQASSITTHIINEVAAFDNTGTLYGIASNIGKF